jgi:hypothetical protein
VEEPWDQRSQVFKSVADGNQYDYRDLETGDVYLTREISVARYKDVKIGRG